MSGTIIQTLTPSVTHVVMAPSSVFGRKYSVASTIGKPIVSVSFISQCEKRAKELFQQFPKPDRAEAATIVEEITVECKLLPFAGCMVSSTGFKAEERKEIERLVVNPTPASNSLFNSQLAGNDLGAVGGGGSYLGILTSDCTHLVAHSCKGAKYKFATERKMRIVSFDWFTQCLVSGTRQDESKYGVDAFEAEMDDSNEKAATRATSASVNPTVSSALAGEDERVKRSFSETTTKYCNGGIPPTRESSVSSTTLFCATGHTRSRIISRHSTVATDVSAVDYSVDLPSGLTGSLTIDNDIGDDEDIDIEAKAKPSPKPIFRTGGSSSMLPPQPRYANMSVLRKAGHLQRSEVAVSMVGRPFASANQHSADEPDAFVDAYSPCSRKRKSIDNDMQDIRPSSKNQRTNLDPELDNSGVPFSSSPPRLELSSEPSASNPQSLLPFRSEEDGLSLSPMLFSNCLFTALNLSGQATRTLQRVVDERGGTYSPLEDFVSKGGGGMSIDETSAANLVERAVDGLVEFAGKHTNKRVYLVIQLRGSAHVAVCEAVTARQANTHVVTECWIEQCLLDNVLYPDYLSIGSPSVTYPGLSRGQHVLFAPLKHSNIDGAQKLSLSISGYEGAEREHIGRLAQALGLAFSEQFSRKTTTHLICHPFSKGAKYERANKWRIEVISAFWLYNMAVTGKLLDDCVSDSERHMVTTPCNQRQAQQQTIGTPGRTPLDISLDRNLQQALGNNERKLRMRNRSLVYRTVNAGQTDHDDGNDSDTTQMSPTHENSKRRLQRHGGSETALADMAPPILNGVVVAFSTHLYPFRAELTVVATQLGCKVLPRFDCRQTTHLVHRSRQKQETIRDYRRAIQHNIHVVSPAWLYGCLDAKIHLSENAFPYNLDSERRLTLVSTQPSVVKPQRQHVQDRLLSSSSTTIEPAQEQHEGGESATLSQMEQGRITGQAEWQNINDLFGKRPLGVRRKYRQSGSGELQTQSVTTTTTTIASDSQNQTSKPNRTTTTPNLEDTSRWWLNMERNSSYYTQETPPKNWTAGGLDNFPSTNANMELAASPRAVNKTTIVYGEDAEAMSERDRLLRKLAGN